MNSDFTRKIAASQNLRQGGKNPIESANAVEPPSNPNKFDRMPPGELPCVAILTALPQDFLAVEQHLQNVDEYTHTDGTIYGIGVCPNNAWNVAIVEIGRGNSNAAEETRRAIDWFKPQVVMFVGIAGGRNNVEIGDVVAATKVYHYQAGQGKDIFEFQPEIGRSTYDLEQIARSVTRSWMRRKTTENLPNAFVAPIASGAVIRKSSRSGTAKLLAKNYDDALAIEMEGYGFLAAAQRTQGLSAIVIRGISNLLDGKVQANAADSEELAAKNASAFAFEMLAKLNGKGSGNSKSYVDRDSTQIGMVTTLPDNVVGLSIEEREDDEYWIRAVYGRNKLEKTGKFAPLLRQLSQTIDSGITSANLIGELDRCNEQLENYIGCPIGRFLQWFQQLSTQVDFNPESTILAIADRTDLDIPWELLEVDAIPLGVTLQTIRQLHIKEGLNYTNHCCYGSVLAYTTISTHKYYFGDNLQYFDVFEDFLTDLKITQVAHGLVFINGFSIQEILEINPTAWIKRANLFKTRSSIVFVNGQLNFAEPLRLKHSEFLKLFLRHGAKGVVGTLKLIDERIAEHVVKTFFAMFEEQQENLFTVPAILRQMRKDVHDRLYREQITDEISSLYLATFQYIYDGNPLATLQITRSNS
jgi:nucleoside phosphorylase